MVSEGPIYICQSRGRILTILLKIYVDLNIALNYGQATGACQLLRFVTEHVEVRTNFPEKNNGFFLGG